jgi:ketosteroid isomerase-like protein
VTTPAGAERIRAVLEALHRARERFDRAAAAALLTEEVEHHMPKSFVAEPVTGRDAVAWGLTDGVARYYDTTSLHREVVRTIVENDVAVVEQRLNGRTHDGTPFYNSYVWVYEFRGDLIHRMTEYADTLLAHRAFGGVHPMR